MKRTAAIILAFMMIIVFTGCKGDSPSEKAAKEAEKAIEEAKDIFK